MMNFRFLKQSTALTLLFLVTAVIVFSQSPVDLSEKIMKIKGQYPNSFGDKGFGFYDWGDDRYKILNWNFDLIHSFPLVIGEGPGEIKPYVYNAFIHGDRLYVNGHLAKSINLYSLKGEFLTGINLEIMPRHIILHNKKIYAFSSSFIYSSSSTLAHILNADTGKLEKKIELKSPIPKPKDLGDDISMYFIHFDIGDDNLIYMLHSLDNSVLVIDLDGNVTKKVRLPLKSDVSYSTDKSGENVRVSLNTRAFYNDIKCSKETFFVTFMKTVKFDQTTKEKIYKTHLLRFDRERKLVEKIHDGNHIILGEHKNTLYLFERYEYTALPVRIIH